MGFFASLDKRRWVTVLATLLLAFLSGHVMQTVLADRADVATTEDGPDAGPALRDADEGRKALPVPPAATLIPIILRPPVMPDRVDEPHASTEREGCTPVLVVSAAPAATVRLQLEAPCHALETVSVQQGDIQADVKVGENGSLQLRMPALSERPVVQVEMSDRELVSTAKVPDANQFQHVAIQWEGRQELRINAYEFGARKSQFGHVWSGAPKSPARAVRGTGGFLTRIGNGSGRSAEIYSFPAGQSAARGVIRLEAEAITTRDNCAVTVLATALQTGPLGDLSPTEVRLTMPDCDRVGEIVRLHNLFQDMRLAGR